MKTIDIHQGEVIFPVRIFVVQDIPRIVVAGYQFMAMKKDCKGYKIIAKLLLFNFIESFDGCKGWVRKKTAKEIPGMEYSPPIYMHVSDRSGCFDSAALQAHRIPIGSFGFGGTEEGINETIEHGRARIFLDNHRDTLLVCGDDRIAAVAKYVIDREFLLRQPPDEVFKIGIVRMNDCFYARKIHGFSVLSAQK